MEKPNSVSSADSQENLLLYDYLSFTSKIHSVENLVEMLGLEGVDWMERPGARGYRKRIFFENISIFSDGGENQGVWVEMSGQGCRSFETYGNGDYETVFDTIVENEGEMNLTRLDVAFDDHTGILPLSTLCQDTIEQRFISRFSDWQVIQSSKGAAVNHGSMKSEVYLRIYDKAMERGCAPGTHWIRIELQFRRERALNFIKLNDELGQMFSGVLVNYLRYVEPDTLDSNKSRWALMPYWADLLSTVTPIRIYKEPGVDYNLQRLENYVYNQAGNAIDAVLSYTSAEDFKKKLKERGTKPNLKYIHAVEEFKQSLLEGVTTYENQKSKYSIGSRPAG